MSTKPCPRCGSAVPLQARFCGQCGFTFQDVAPQFTPQAAPHAGPQAAPHAPGVAGSPTAFGHGRVPTTVDEATADPPPAAAPPAPVPAAPAPTPRRSDFAKTSLGLPEHGPAGAPAASSRSAAEVRRDLSRTALDPEPFGAAAEPYGNIQDLGPGEAAPPSNRDLPLSAQPTREVVQRAEHPVTSQRPTAPAPAPGPVPSATAPSAPEPRPAQPFGKTLVLGGVSAADLLPPEVLNAPTAAPPPMAHPAEVAARHEASPLSLSVAAPSSGLVTPGAPAPSAIPPPVQSGAPAGPPAPTAAGSDKRTMLGMPAVDLPAPPAANPGAPPGAFPSTHKTMLGVAMPGIAPTHEPPPEPPRQGTLLGVAVPGIAPLQPGVEAPRPAGGYAAQPQPQASPAPPPIVPPPPPLVHEPLPEAPSAPKRKGVPALALVAIVFVLVAALGTVGALVILKAGGPITAQPQLDENGKESLRLHCESCPDGTTISLGAASATVQAANAVLALPAPLAIGDNDLELAIDRPAAGRDETVKLHVPVAYRVKADLTTLSASPPVVSVRVEVTPGAEVTVDGKPVSLDGSNKGVHAIDVAADASGPSDEQKVIDKKIPFTIKPKGKAEEAGELTVHAAIAPLHIDAPGTMLITDRSSVAIAGQTKPSSVVTVDGQAVNVDPQGRFGVRLELPPGDKTLTITASSAALAPRTVRAKVTRVASLEDSAKTLDGASPLAFATFSADPAAHAGKAAAVDGEIVEVRGGQGYAVYIVEEKKACTSASCVVRVVSGEDARGARGDAIRAWGRLVGSVTSGGSSVPDLEASLVIAKPAGTKR